MSATAAIITEVYARLDASLEAGGLLEGWTFERQPVEVIEGSKDKPSLHVSMPTLNEVQVGSEMAKATVRITMGISSRREVTRKGADAITDALEQHADNVEKVRNTVERTTGGTADMLMLGLLLEPLRWESGEAKINSGSFNTGLTLVMPLRAARRGAR